MHPLDRVPAIRRIDTDRPDVFAMEITGEVTSADVENLFGLLEGAYALHDSLDLIVRFSDYRGLLTEGMSWETTREVREHARNRIRRCALVGDAGALRDARSFLDLPSSVEHRDFAAEDEGEAWAWIGARER